MGVRFPSVFSTAVLAVLPSNGAETIICTTPPLTLPLDTAPVFVLWWFVGSSGAGTTALTVRLRRGPALTSPSLLTDAAVLVTAAAITNLNGVVVDTPGAAAGVQYSFCLVGTGTTGAGTATDMVLTAFSL